jgi:hypothetical protein
MALTADLPLDRRARVDARLPSVAAGSATFEHVPGGCSHLGVTDFAWAHLAL